MALAGRMRMLQPDRAAWHRRRPRAEIGRQLIVSGAFLLAIVTLGAVLAPLLSPWGPEEIDFAAFLVPPSASHPLGTDGNGMDLWSRVLFAARIDIGISIAAVAIAVVSGSLVGGVVGYIGGWVDEIAMRLTDIVQAFPAFILALTVSAMFGSGLFNLTVAIGLIFAPAYVRIVRSEDPYVACAGLRRGGGVRGQHARLHPVPPPLSQCPDAGAGHRAAQLRAGPC